MRSPCTAPRVSPPTPVTPCWGENTSRALLYVAMTRGRHTNTAHLYERATGDHEYGHQESDGTHLKHRGDNQEAADLLRGILANDQPAITATRLRRTHSQRGATRPRPHSAAETRSSHRPPTRGLPGLACREGRLRAPTGASPRAARQPGAGPKLRLRTRTLIADVTRNHRPAGSKSASGKRDNFLHCHWVVSRGINRLRSDRFPTQKEATRACL